MGLLFYVLSKPPPPVLDLAPKTALKPFCMADPPGPRPPRKPTSPDRFNNSSLSKELVKVKETQSSSPGSPYPEPPTAFNAACMSAALAERSRFCWGRKTFFVFPLLSKMPRTGLGIFGSKPILMHFMFNRVHVLWRAVHSLRQKFMGICHQECHVYSFKLFQHAVEQ